MTTYRVYCKIPGTSVEGTIEAREMTVNEGAYMFWKGEYGETNKLIASYPVAFTIVETVEEVDPS
jgi:hypothetical protein